MSNALRATYDTQSTNGYRSQEAHELHLAVQNSKAAQVVAGRATNLEDCRELLAMLGLDADNRRPTAAR